MTKGELIELLDGLGWDDPVFLDFGDGLENICEVDSEVMDIEGVGIICVLSSCLSHEPQEVDEVEDKMEELIQKQRRPEDN